MNRRNFLKVSAGAAGLTALGYRALGADTNASSPETDRLIRELILANDAAIPAQLARQERRAGHRWLGGIPNEYGIHLARATSSFVASLACALGASDSKYFQSADLVEPLTLAARYLLAAQHEDGTTDLPETNFHSPPDTAFCLESLFPAYLLLRSSKTAGLEPVLGDLATFLKRAGDGLAIGGVHTPNHRWVYLVSYW